MTNGTRLFARYAFPPNSLGYCGPEDPRLLEELMSARPDLVDDDLRHVAQGFAGAWPYLALIGQEFGLDPIDSRVVEAYWIGNPLLDRIDLANWGNSLDDRFALRAGSNRAAIEDSVALGGVPTHSFHVFCVYPWVGLLRTGTADQALEVIDNCRIRWGTVTTQLDETRFAVESNQLTWDGSVLDVTGPVSQVVRRPIDPGVQIGPGDTVALHWDYISDTLTRRQVRELHNRHGQHLDLVNRETRRLDRVLST